MLILGCRLLEVIPVEGVKNYLSVYKDVVIGKYDRICDMIDENNTKKYQIQVECSRCPKTGNFCIYLIMKANIITGEEHHGEEFNDNDTVSDYTVNIPEYKRDTALTEALEDNMSTDYCYDILLENINDYL